MNLIVNIAGILIGFALGYILSYLHTKQDQQAMQEYITSNEIVLTLQKEVIELYERQVNNYEKLVEELGATNE